VADLVADGLEGYTAFAPADWAVPDERGAEAVARGRASLEDPDAFGLLAEEDGSAVGVVLWVPEPDDPDCVYFRNLFVRSSHWGSGLAAELHRRAVDEARERGWLRMRLLTPALQQRARRFYEREGWTLSREPYDDAKLGMQVVEYRRELAG
jgi:GNAT superfamily N-acetyltransferase